ncbi:MAG: L-serine ammonia-lyase [Lentisphaerae bacterium GWF2_45_14]|nr:MAG: L-serine ammonia-lyase [Lentisphaerae bacterium GWF2_45_14]
MSENNSPFIDTSVFDLFKIGPGPSSSHTIGPMKAAGHFLAVLKQIPATELAKATDIKIELYGSLSLTGKGHGTDRSIVGGLLGWEPENCDCAALSRLLSSPDEKYYVHIGAKAFALSSSSIDFGNSRDGSIWQNTMVLKLMTGNMTMLEKEYYSVGGGFIKCKDDDSASGVSANEPFFKYNTMNGLKDILKKNNIRLSDLILKNEAAISGMSEDDVQKRLDRIITVMCDAVSRGINTEGILPGPIKLARKAPALYRRAGKMGDSPDRFLAFLNSYALAVSEENAAGHRVVTAPTSGSAGVVPAVVYLLRHHFFMLNHEIAEGLLAAASVGFVARHNASISGAEVGCQGEIGVASAMAAALVTYVNGYSTRIVENAAEIALEHHLGMTCDPVDGYVQIPCIERNAVGAIDAYNAYLLASIGDPHKQKVTLDDVIKAMLETGRDMSSKYKETALGGLAACSICC